MSIVSLSKKKCFVLEFEMEFINYTIQARSQGGGGEGGGGGRIPPRTEFAQNITHAFLYYALDCILVSMRNNLKNHKIKPTYNIYKKRCIKIKLD